MSNCCESVNSAQDNEYMCCRSCCCGSNNGVAGDTSNNGCEFDTDMILWVLIIIVIVSCCGR